MSSTALKELLVDELKDLYNAENQLLKALPKMAKAAADEQLRAGFEKHLEETEGHVDRLEKAFKMLGEPVKGKTCPAMKGLIEEGAEAIKEHDASAVRDAQLIGSAQRIEHYEIAAYGTVRSLAETLGEDDLAELLQETLDEEGETDKQLTRLSSTINQAALEEDAEEDEEE